MRIINSVLSLRFYIWHLLTYFVFLGGCKGDAMQFSTKKLKNNSTFGSWHTPLRKFLDPPMVFLNCSSFSGILFFLGQVLVYSVRNWPNGPGSFQPQHKQKHVPVFGRLIQKLAILTLWTIKQCLALKWEGIMYRIINGFLCNSWK